MKTADKLFAVIPAQAGIHQTGASLSPLQNRASPQHGSPASAGDDGGGGAIRAAALNCFGYKHKKAPESAFLQNSQIKTLTLRELEAPAGFGFTVFLALDFAAVAGQEAACLEYAAQIWLVINERPADPKAQRPGLP